MTKRRFYNLLPKNKIIIIISNNLISISSLMKFPNTAMFTKYHGINTKYNYVKFNI